MLKQKNAINGGQNWEYNLHWLFGYPIAIDRAWSN